MDGFFSSRTYDISQTLLGISSTFPFCRVRFIRVQNTEKGLKKYSKHPPATHFFYIFSLFSNACRALSQCDTRLRLLDLLIIIRNSPEYWSLENKYAIEPGSLSLVGCMGLLRVGSLLSEGLLFSGVANFGILLRPQFFGDTFGGEGDLFFRKFMVGV